MSCSQFGYSGGSSTSQLLMAGQSTGQQIHGTAGASSQPCCESGRPVMTDPLTGQTVCSCQYDAQLLNYQRLAASGLPLNMYGTAVAAAAAYTGEQGFLPLSAEQSAFYSPSANGFDLKDNLEAWRSLPYAASMYYPYDSAALAGYPFPNGYGVDLNGARRKNATRETTSTLKAWLNEHRKNPYPTKGEKIMLAIITKMTLTQVSTWFANARRRLKKENKMTWSPRNRCDDDDGDADAEDGVRPKDIDNKDGDRDIKDGGESDMERRAQPRDVDEKMSEHDTRQEGVDGKGDFVDVDDDCKSCASTSNEGHVLNSSDKENYMVDKPRVASPVSDASLASDSESSQASVLMSSAASIHQSATTELQATPKPRIWSIVDTATSTAPSSSSHSSVTTPETSRLSPLQRASRIDYLSPYPKPSSWYAGTLGGISVSTSGSFPLSAVYTCPPIVPSASALSSMAHPVSSGTASGSVNLTDSSAVSSLNRLRTAAAAFPSSDLSLYKTAVSSASTSVFNLSSRMVGASAAAAAGVVQPSGSAAAIAAVAGVSSAAAGATCSSNTQGRVLS